jgi:DNA polymerase-3 subunit alpha (Gram-positive type)
VFVAPVSSVNHLIASNRSTTAEVVHAILRIISMARKCQKPVAAVSACYYLDKNEQIVHDVFIHAKRIEKGIHPFYVRNVDAPPLLHYRTTEEMLEEFSFVGSSELINEIVIKNTYKFADMCERIEINKKELYTPEIENVDAMLQDVVSKKLFEIYGHNIAKEIVERKDIELQMILSKRYSVIY